MDCCVPKRNEAARVLCRGCGQIGRPVGGVTVEAILEPAHAAPLDARFCRSHDCEIL